MDKIVNIKTLSEMFRFVGINAPKHPLIAFMDFSKTGIPSELLPIKVVTNFYQISLKGQEHGSMKYGRETYDYQEGTLVFIAPGQVIEYTEYTDGTRPSGWSLFFHPDLIRTFPLQKRMKEFSFFQYQSNEALHSSEDEMKTITTIASQIDTELNSNIDEFSEEVIVSNLELLLNYSKRFYNRQFITRKRFTNDVIAKFEEALEEYFEKELQHEYGIPNVQYFADQLNYSASYLSDMVRKNTGRSMIEHIQHHIIELAKNRLLNSNDNIAEISFALGFEYSQYFSRLFKKHSGMTPKEFRNNS
jgi:AraC-like DNA-binding protein